MERKTFILDGNNFSNLEEFYSEVEKVLTKDFKGFGRNLDAFNDVLCGGFGSFEYEEPITIIWLNTNKSKKELGATFNTLIEIIKEQPHIQFIIK
jgi:RNAse (barnase) inhibitor barstar